MQCVIAGGRATTGIRSGRYCFEVRYCEESGVAPGWRTVLIGVGTGRAAYVPGCDEFSIAFDHESALRHNGREIKKLGKRFVVGDSITLLVNLDAQSENFQTISLFHNGIRMGDPYKLPEALRDEVLFPMVGVR